MEPNVKNIKNLINEKFNGNKAAFSKVIGVERSQISNLLNYGNCCGAKFYGGLMVYCEENNLDFKNYVFLPSASKK